MALRTLGDVLARSKTSVTVSDNANIRTLAAALMKHNVYAVCVLAASGGHLCGIATSRDIAKCIARNLDLDTTPVSIIMTPNPITLPPSETPANALALMRQGRFRHIPVVSPDSKVIGIVDVLSLAYDAITRLQLSYSMIPSRRGYDLLRAARETIEKPTLRPIIERSSLNTLRPHNTISEACELIVTKHTAAVVVVDENGVIDGIFTCTDIVKRVVLPKKDPTAIKVSDVMTINPDCASPDFTILECLQRMQACGFRHLPVVDDISRIVVGIVDVLELASDTLIDLNSATSNNNKRTGTNNPTQQPPSSRSSNASSSRVGLGRGLANFFGSLFTNSYAQRDSRSDSGSNEGGLDIPIPPANNITNLAFSNIPQAPKPMSIEPRSPTRRHYGYMPASSKGRSRQTRADVPLASFKLKDINGDFRRIKVPMVLEQGDFDQFVLDVRRRYSGGSSASIGAIRIKYIDEDGDDILIAHDDDLASCFEDLARGNGKTVMLKVEQERSTSSKLQSPVSSAPSSAMGSPRRPAVTSSETASEQEDEGEDVMPLSVEPPELEKPLPWRDERRPSGVYRTNSKLRMHTPSSKKASDGHQLMLDQRVDEAIICLTEALQLDENNARAMGERGAAHLLNGCAKEAEEDYRGAIKLIDTGKGGKTGDMTHQMCIVGLAEALIDQSRYEEGVDAAMNLNPQWGNSGCVDAFRDELESASNAAREALASGEWVDAMGCFSNAIRVESGYLKLVSGGDEMGRASLRLGRAKCYMAIEDYEMALEDYEEAAKLDSESVSAQKGRGKCLMKLENLPLALEAYEKAHGLDPSDEEVSNEIKTLKTLLPDPLKSKKEKIAELGAMLGGLNLPKKG